MNRKRVLAGLLVYVLAAFAFCIPASYAGEYDLTVAAEGKGVEVYSSYTAKKPDGILYNGFMSCTYPTEKNGRMGFGLTDQYCAYLSVEKAEELLPEPYNPFGGDSYEDIYRSMRCGAFEVEVSADSTTLYSDPNGKKTKMTCYKGTRTVVWGEFGDKYFVDEQGYFGITGFIAKKDVSHVADLGFWEANKEIHTDEYKNRFEEKTVYTDGGHIHIAEDMFFDNGDKVRVKAYTGNGQAQVLDYGYIETRFLDPEGDHTTNNVYATVKTDSPINRLRLESVTVWDKNLDIVHKICSGVRVEVLETEGNTALVCLYGTANKKSVMGKAKKEFLVFGDAGSRVESGCTRVKLTEEYEGFPAGTLLTVAGCNDVNEAGNPDFLIALTDAGELVEVYNEDGIVEPLEPSGFKAKAASDVLFREKPNKEGKKIKMLRKGAVVEVLLRGECWTMIRENKTVGYVMSRYLRFFR